MEFQVVMIEGLHLKAQVAQIVKDMGYRAKIDIGSNEVLHKKAFFDAAILYSDTGPVKRNLLNQIQWYQYRSRQVIVIGNTFSKSDIVDLKKAGASSVILTPYLNLKLPQQIPPIDYLVKKLQKVLLLVHTELQDLNALIGSH